MDHSIDEAAARHGVVAREVVPGLVAGCVEVDGFVYSSGHVSAMRGQAGSEVDLEAAKTAARESIVDMLAGVLSVRGTLEDLRVVKLLGCINAADGFADHPAVMNEASQIIRDVFGPERGEHARSALGFSSLPLNATVEIEAIFRVVE